MLSKYTLAQEPRARYHHFKPGLSFLIPLTSVLLLLLLNGCGSTAPATPTVAESFSPAATSTSTVTVASTTTPTTTTASTPAISLHGPTNFVLITPLNYTATTGSNTDNSGKSTQLDPQIIETQLTGEITRLLFVVSVNNTITVYTPGGTTPIAAKTSQQADGSALITFSQTLNSLQGTVTLVFTGTLQGNQIDATYGQSFTPSLMSNATASTVEASFTAQVKWVAASDIPTAPANGQYQVFNKTSVALTWSPGTNAAAYDVYRLIPDRDQQFQLLTTVNTASYTDNSPEVAQYISATQGITYAIFSVGPTGVENPGDVAIQIPSQA